MSSHATRPWIASCRRKLAAVLCVLLLATGLFHTHADAGALDTSMGNVAVRAAQAGADAEERADTVPAHAASHCTCKDMPVPPDLGGRTALLVRPASFAATLSHALHPGALAPPMEPPRA